MSQEVSKWLINGLYPTYKRGILGKFNPLILTIDPNSQRDIPVGITFPWSWRTLNCCNKANFIKFDGSRESLAVNRGEASIRFLS